MSKPNLIPFDVKAYRDPPHVEASIGPRALGYRAEILDRVLPEISARLTVYEAVLRCCFFDEEAKVNATQRLGEILTDLGRLNKAMCDTSFTAGEA